MLQKHTYTFFKYVWVKFQTNAHFCMTCSFYYGVQMSVKAQVSCSWKSILELWGVACYMESQNAATRHKRTHPALTLASEGWYLIYLPQRDGRLSWPKCLITHGPGIEPTTARSNVWHPTAALPRHPVAHKWWKSTQPKFFRFHCKRFHFYKIWRSLFPFLCYFHFKNYHRFR